MRRSFTSVSPESSRQAKNSAGKRCSDHTSFERGAHLRPDTDAVFVGQQGGQLLLFLPGILPCVEDCGGILAASFELRIEFVDLLAKRLDGVEAVLLSYDIEA